MPANLSTWLKALVTSKPAILAVITGVAAMVADFRNTVLPALVLIWTAINSATAKQATQIAQAAHSAAVDAGKYPGSPTGRGR